MTDKEIAEALKASRMKSALARLAMHPSNSRMWAIQSVCIIHHIIASIDWED